MSWARHSPWKRRLAMGDPPHRGLRPLVPLCAVLAADRAAPRRPVRAASPASLADPIFLSAFVAPISRRRFSCMRVRSVAPSLKGNIRPCPTRYPDAITVAHSSPRPRFFSSWPLRRAHASSIPVRDLSKSGRRKLAITSLRSSPAMIATRPASAFYFIARHLRADPRNIDLIERAFAAALADGDGDERVSRSPIVLDHRDPATASRASRSRRVRSPRGRYSASCARATRHRRRGEGARRHDDRCSRPGPGPGTGDLRRAHGRS